MKKTGVVTLLIGAAIIVFALVMDTSVSTGTGSHVNNIGLLQQQMVFVMLGGFVAVVGAVLIGANSLGIGADKDAAQFKHSATLVSPPHSLSLSRAWDETREVAGRDGKLIAAVALALFFLPGVMAGLVNPQAGAFPETTRDTVIMLVVALIALVGQLAIIRMALGARMTVGEAIGHGARRVPSYLVAGLIWAGPLIVAGYFVGGEVWRAPETATGGQAGAALLILVMLLVVGIRMMMTSPVATAEQAGPLAIVKRSWQLTSGHWWKLFALLCIFVLVMAIVMGALGAILGIVSRLLFEQIEPMSVGALFVAAAAQLVSAIFTTGLLIMLARIYAQLAGPAHDDVSVPSSGT